MAQVIQRALEKHHLEHMDWEEFTLTQVLSQDRGEDTVTWKILSETVLEQF